MYLPTIGNKIREIREIRFYLNLTKEIITMHSVKLKINDKIYEDLLCLFRKFSKDELEIVIEDPTLQETNLLSSSQNTNATSSQQYLASLQQLRDKSHFDENKLYLEFELKKITDGNAAFYSIDEVEHRLNLMIKKYEDKL